MKNYKIFNINISFIFTLFVIALIIPSILPLFRQNFFKMHDYTHVARLQQLDQALKDGHFPVRWSKDLGWGYGMPLFNFYAPLPYYVAEIFHLIGFSFLNAIKIIFGLTFFIGFVGMFLLAKEFWGKYGGLLAGLAFVYSPYRAVDFYVRGALGELFAISLIPWAIWAVYMVVKKRTNKYLSISAFILACLFLSHTVLTLISFPILLIIGLFFVLLFKDKLKGLLYVLASFILSLGLACFFLIPAFFEKDFTKVGDLIGGFSHYGHHFLYFRQFLSGNWGYGGSVDGIDDLMSFHLGKGHLLLVFITIAFVLFAFIQNRFKLKVIKKYSIIILFSLLSLFLAFLTTYHSKLIWDAVPLMAFIQFPWRFNSLIIVFIGFLSGGGCLFIKKKFGNRAVLVYLILSILMLLKLNVCYFRPEEYINPNDFYYTDEALIRENISGVIPDYIPTWFKQEVGLVPKEEVKSVSGNPQIKIIESKTNKLFLEVETDKPSVIQVNRFYFPGWQVKVDSIKEEINYQDHGLIEFSISKIGKFFVEISFKDTIVRKISNFISMISFVLLILIYTDNFKDKLDRKKFDIRKWIN